MVPKLDNTGLQRLLSSPNWREFHHSLAEGLRISLAICRGQERFLTVGARCAQCSGGGNDCPTYLPRSLPALGEPALVACEHGTVHAVCHLAGEQILDVVYLGRVGDAPAAAAGGELLPPISREELRTRARAARTAIAGFVMAFFAATAWDRRGLEMAALQEVARTVIPLLELGQQALEKALDLILSCLMILLDPAGCWLLTSDQLTLVRGDVAAVSALLDSGKRAAANTVQRPIGAGGEWGRLGVLRPVDAEWAAEVLAQLADQTQICLEVDRLQRLAQRHDR